MMQPVQSLQSRLNGEPAAATGSTTPLLSDSQLSKLNDLVSRLSAYSGQQENDIWALLRRDLGVTGHNPLLSRHFPPAEQHLNSRLQQALQNASPASSHRQLLSQISELISKNNNRQPLSDYLSQQFGSTSLHSLNRQQLQHILSLLQNGQLSHRGTLPLATNASPATVSTRHPPLLSLHDIPRLTQRQLSHILHEILDIADNRLQANRYLQHHYGHTMVSLLTSQQQKTLLTLLLNGQLAATANDSVHSLIDEQTVISPSQLKTLNQLIIRLASLSGQSPASFWQTLLSLSNASSAQQLAASQFPVLSHWLLSLQHIASQPSSDTATQSAPTAHAPPRLASLTLNDLRPYLQPYQQHPSPGGPQPPHSTQTSDWQQIVSHAQQQWQLTPHSVLSHTQLQHLLYLISQLRLRQPFRPQPVYNPVNPFFSDPVARLASKPALLLTLTLAAAVILWLLC